ncbi:MAG: PaaX family transcriptional regulator [Acidimicrobiia bacterium]|nr:PaaX family transcriptional regulator [Acidimicrobiia bacterium]
MPYEIVERQANPASLAPIAPILGATSDGRATADSARGLLITVLGEFVSIAGGTAWTQTLIEAMEGLGVQPKSTRQVMARLADQNWLGRERLGRRTRWSLTETSRTLLQTGAERIYGFGHDRAEWNGRWLVLMVSLGERDQHHRYKLTTGLSWAGFGSLGQGSWVSPWIDNEAEAVELLAELDVQGATSFVSEVGQLGSGASLASRAWDLEATRRHYCEFLDFTRSINPHATGVEAAVHLTMLVHQWRRFPFLDPELPAELLPTDWPAGSAVDHFADLRRALIDAARDWWISTDAGYGPSST